MTGSQIPSPFGLSKSQHDGAQSLDSLHLVERMASAPGPKRPDAWRDDLLGALQELGADLHAQQQDSLGRRSLLSDIKIEAPHLVSSIDELLEREDRLADDIDELERTMADLSRPLDVERLRAELAELTRELRELRAWETDIVYEVYSVDLGIGG